MWEKNIGSNTMCGHLSTWMTMKLRRSTLFSTNCHLSSIDYSILIIKKRLSDVWLQINLYRALTVFLIGLVHPSYMSQISKNWLCIKNNSNLNGREKKSMPFLPISISIALLLITLFIIQLVTSTRLHK